MTTMLTIKILFTISSPEKKKGKKLFIKITIILYFYSLIKLIYMWRCHCVLTSL